MMTHTPLVNIIAPFSFAPDPVSLICVSKMDEYEIYHASYDKQCIAYHHLVICNIITVN